MTRYYPSRRRRTVKSGSFDAFGGWCAILAGVSGFLYSVAFVIVARSDPQVGGTLSALFLILVGLTSSAALTALYERLRLVNPGAALWGLLLGVIAAMGSAIHGGYDLANLLHASAAATANAAGDL